MRVSNVLMVVGLLATPAWSQSFNVDFGEVGNGPPATYDAAGRAGTWNSVRGDHGATVTALLDLDGNATGVRFVQIGGLDTRTVVDPATQGDDSLLMDDYLVTFSAGLESCVFFDGLAPGEYEVLIYARMPNLVDVLSYTSVDQEPGFPHYSVGGAWTGEHEELITFSRHRAIVDARGSLDLHSGIVPGASAALGAALNGIQLLKLSVFSDGFESGDFSGWDGVVE